VFDALFPVFKDNGSRVRCADLVPVALLRDLHGIMEIATYQRLDYGTVSRSIEVTIFLTVSMEMSPYFFDSVSCQLFLLWKKA
jgi:hypothetical protein